MVEHPCFSRLYILGEASLERFVGELRRYQNQRARGRTLIVGAGTGLDVPQLSENVTDVVLLEPDPTMRTHLQKRYPNLSISADTAEHMRAADDQFDTVISSLVLCSVQNMEQVLTEIHRVLRPEGQYLFLEHVQHQSFFPRSTQNVINPIWKRLGGGCHLNRDVYSALKASPFHIAEYSVKKLNLIAPIVSGQALKQHERDQNPNPI